MKFGSLQTNLYICKTIKNKEMNNIETKVERITPELAKKYLDRNTTNRQLSKPIVEFYAKEMLEGRWMLNGEPIQFSKNGLLLNGQHRLKAIILADKAIDILVVRGLEESTFVTFDSGKNRSISNVLDIANVPNYCIVGSIVNRYLSITISNATFIGGADNKGSASSTHYHFGSKRKSKADILDEYNKTPELYQRIATAAQTYSRRVRILFSSEIGGMAAYLIKEKKHPEEFVLSFFDMLTNVSGCYNPVIRALQSKLIKDLGETRRFSPVYKQQLIIKAWNYYVQGKEVNQLIYNEAKEGKLHFI